MTAINGQAEPTPTIDDVIARRELALGQLEVKLLESMLADDFGGSDALYDLQRQKYGDGAQWIPIAAVSDRRDGKNFPLWQSETDLARYRQASRIVCQKNAYAISALGNLCNYIIGKGFTYRVQPKKSRDQSPSSGVQVSESDKQIANALQGFVDEFLSRNRWTATVIADHNQVVVAPTREREACVRLYRDGESILRLFHFGDGLTAVRFVEPEQVADPPSKASGEGWSYGMRHCMEPFEDEETIEEYYLKYKDASGKADAGELVPASEIVHIKNPNQDASIKRGLPAFSLDTIDALERASKLQRNVSISSAIRAATAEIWKHQQSSEAQVGSLAQRLAERTVTNPITGKSEMKERRDPGGIRRVPAGMDPVWPQAVGASEHLAIAQGDLRQAVAAFNAPEYFTGDASNANYASTKEAGTPFVLASEVVQEHFKVAFTVVVLKAIVWAMKQGRLPTNCLEACELQVETPRIAVRDPLQTAQEDQILVGAKIKSPQTCQMERGLDPEHEQANMEEFDERNGGGGNPLAAMMGGGPAMESLDLFENKSGVFTDKLGHKYALQDGKRVALGGGNEHAEQSQFADIGSDAAKNPLAKFGGLDHKSVAIKRLAQFGKTVSHAEHKVMGFDYLPHPLNIAARGLKAVAFASYTAGQKAVEAVAAERGFTSAQTASLTSALAVADLVGGGKLFPFALKASGLGAMAMAGSFVPVASLGYLAYSTARNPMATLRAARAGVNAGLKKLRLVESVDTEQEIDDLADHFAKYAGREDDFLARFCVALEATGGDKDRALQVAVAAMSEDGPAPADDESRESIIADIVGGWQEQNGGLQESLEAELLEAGFTGTVTDKLGRKYTYQDGKRVAGAKKQPAAKPDKGGPESKPAVTARGQQDASTKKKPRAQVQHEARQKIEAILAGNVTPEAHAELIQHLGSLTIPQLKALRDEKGLKSSGRLKADLVKSIGENFRQQMVASGSVNVEALQDRIKPFESVEVPTDKVRFAKAQYEAAKAQYGTLLVHRLEELADEHIQAIDDLPKGARSDREHHSQELHLVGWMLGKALKDGISGQIEDPSLKNFKANLDRISLGERLKGTPWTAFLLKAIRDRFAINNDTGDEKIWNGLKEGRYKGPRLDEALQALRTDYGTMTQQQLLSNVLPKLKSRKDTVGEKVSADDSGKGKRLQESASDVKVKKPRRVTTLDLMEGFTGIDSNGHKWVNGEQVKRDDKAGEARSSKGPQRIIQHGKIHDLAFGAKHTEDGNLSTAARPGVLRSEGGDPLAFQLDAIDKAEKGDIENKAGMRFRMLNGGGGNIEGEIALKYESYAKDLSDSFTSEVSSYAEAAIDDPSRREEAAGSIAATVDEFKAHLDQAENEVTELMTHLVKIKHGASAGINRPEIDSAISEHFDAMRERADQIAQVFKEAAEKPEDERGEDDYEDVDSLGDDLESYADNIMKAAEDAHDELHSRLSDEKEAAAEKEENDATDLANELDTLDPAEARKRAREYNQASAKNDGRFIVTYDKDNEQWVHQEK